MSAMVWTPRVTVAAVVTRAGRYLMVEERDSSGKTVLNQPAGHLEANESLVEAACREVLEETCREFHPAGLVGIYRWPQFGNERTYLRFCFVGDVDEAVPERQRDPDILATHWLSRAELEAQRERMRSPMVLRCIEDAERNPPTPMDLLHELL
jgi:ADP-ribose pyrophosphatase YjhB (NUDIX family)